MIITDRVYVNVSWAAFPLSTSFINAETQRNQIKAVRSLATPVCSAARFDRPFKESYPSPDAYSGERKPLPVAHTSRRQQPSHRGTLAQASLAWRSSKAWYSLNSTASLGRLSWNRAW